MNNVTRAEDDCADSASLLTFSALLFVFAIFDGAAANIMGKSVGYSIAVIKIGMVVNVVSIVLSWRAKARSKATYEAYKFDFEKCLLSAFEAERDRR